MRRLQLAIDRSRHEPSAAIGHESTLVRIVVQAALRFPEDTPRFRDAIVDTGAPFSVFPLRMWRDKPVETLGVVRIGGVVRPASNRMEALLANVECVLSDGPSWIGPMRIRAYLSQTDEVPLLIGVSGILERLRLVIDLPRSQAFLEEQAAPVATGAFGV